MTLLLAALLAAPGAFASPLDDVPATRCEPRPPADDLPPAPGAACPEGSGPSAEHIHPEPGDGACPRLHRRVAAAVARAWASELERVRRQLNGPLAQAAPELLAASLWNQDEAGKAACAKAQAGLCDRERRAQWLARMFERDQKTLGRVRDLHGWFSGAQAACEALGTESSDDAIKKFLVYNRRFWNDFHRFLGNPAGEPPAKDHVRHLKDLREDYGSASLNVRTLKGWGKALNEWNRSLPERLGRGHDVRASRRLKERIAHLRREFEGEARENAALRRLAPPPAAGKPAPGEPSPPGRRVAAEGPAPN